MKSAIETVAPLCLKRFYYPLTLIYSYSIVLMGMLYHATIFPDAFYLSEEVDLVFRLSHSTDTERIITVVIDTQM